MIIYYLYLILINFSTGFLHNYPFVEGIWILRRTNDINIKNTFSYIDIQTNKCIKIKTIKSGIINTKKSRTCFIKSIKNNNYLLNKIFNIEKYSYDIELIINNVNIYSYSFLVLEIPQIKYQQNSDYNLVKYLNIKQNGNSIYVTDLDNKYYYIFDLNIQQLKLPFIEISVTTLILTKIFDLLCNFILHS